MFITRVSPYCSPLFVIFHKPGSPVINPYFANKRFASLAVSLNCFPISVAVNVFSESYSWLSPKRKDRSNKFSVLFGISITCGDNKESGKSNCFSITLKTPLGVMTPLKYEWVLYDAKPGHSAGCFIHRKIHCCLNYARQKKNIRKWIKVHNLRIIIRQYSCKTTLLLRITA